MMILGIETSCDETAAAVVEDGTRVLSSITATSAGLHARTGGVIPEQAARKQIQSIIPVIELALKEAFASPTTNTRQLTSIIDAIAVTTGPGLIGSLLVGVETAKTLSHLWNVPIIPVNHLLAHIYANWLTVKNLPKFPTLALVVSGGHTDLVLMENHKKIEWIGGTRDDAAGEAFDKTARLLGLPYPGGPSLAKLADEYIAKHSHKKLNLFPRPMIDDVNFDWSFSGLKTAALRKMSELAEEKKFKLSDYQEISSHTKVIKNKSMLAAEIQEAIVDSLMEKSVRAIKKYNVESFLLAGGVAANKRLREKFISRMTSESLNVDFRVPTPALCTDNAAYIASRAYFDQRKIDWRAVITNPELIITDKP